MIASLSGTVAAKLSGQLIVDVGGVGYLVNVSPQLTAATTVGEAIHIRTAFIVRDDAFIIYGFEDQYQLQLFDTLRSVNGVGPKLAATILSELGVDRIANAVSSQDDKVFSSVSGIGPKTAKLLTVSLEGKLFGEKSSSLDSGSKNNGVVLALIGLGWNEKEALQAVELASQNLGADSDDASLLKAALSFRANDRSQVRQSL